MCLEKIGEGLYYDKNFENIIDNIMGLLSNLNPDAVESMEDKRLLQSIWCDIACNKDQENNYMPDKSLLRLSTNNNTIHIPVEENDNKSMILIQRNVGDIVHILPRTWPGIAYLMQAFNIYLPRHLIPFR